jgi:hypothetical protein
MFNVANNTRNIEAADTASFSQSELKQFKEGTISFVSLGTQKFKVTWSEANQQFDVVEKPSLCSSLYQACCCCCSSAAERARIAERTRLLTVAIAATLNQSHQQDQLSRRAERHDPTAAGLYRLLSNSPNPAGATLNIIRAGGEEVLTPALTQGGVMPPVPPAANPPRILLYGISDNRRALATHVVTHFNLQERAVIETIDDYNACLGIPQNLNFLDYCNIYTQMHQQHGLQQRIIPGLSTEATIRTLRPKTQTIGSDPAAAPSNHQQVIEWANHLEAYADKFDFSRKLEASNPTKSLRFVIKNCTSADLAPLDNQNPPRITAGDEYALDAAAVRHFSQRLTGVLNCLRSRNPADYHQLSLPEQTLLDTVVRNAFFRQTSKLGLSFAKTTGVMVLFSWKGDLASGPHTLDALRNALDVKRYKADEPSSRDDGVHEFITYSEMREVGRLLQKMINPQPANSLQTRAPDYLLVSGHS